MIIGIQISHVFDKDVTVPFFVGGSAMEGEDYTLSASPAVIPAGQRTTTITLSLVDDSLHEPDEMVMVFMEIPLNAEKGEPDVHTATIFDDDPTPSVSFFIAGSSGGESVGTINLQVDLKGISALPVTVDYRATGVTATGGFNDYFLAPGTLTFEPGETSKKIVLTVIDDSTNETTETLDIVLSNVSSADLGPISTYTYIIIDNDG